MKKQSVDVLNEADAFERKMRWIEFCAENELSYLDGEWNPGDPLFNRPNFALGEQYVRSMIQELEMPGCDWESNSYFYSDHTCKDCDSRWNGNETKCWFCGLEQNVKKPKFLKANFARFYQAEIQQAQTYATSSYHDYYYVINDVNEFQIARPRCSRPLASLDHYLEIAIYSTEFLSLSGCYKLRAKTRVGEVSVHAAIVVSMRETENSDLNFQELLKDKLREEIIQKFPQFGAC